MLEEWVRNARNEVRAEAHSCAEVEKALGAFKEEHTELANKLIVTERERLNAQGGSEKCRGLGRGPA